MIREILFRGKTKQGEWVYGDLLRQYGVTEIYVDTDTLSEYDLPNYLIIPETVGQYTGLKDKNGNKVFEGDIVKFTDTAFGYSHIGAVCFYKGSFCILYEFYGQKKLHRIGKIDKWQNMGASGTTTYSYEVIGNIHDNKELLGE